MSQAFTQKIRTILDTGSKRTLMDAQTTSLTAVVADDEPEIRDLIAEYLVRRGYQVMQAGDGGGGLLPLRGLPPTLLLLDLMMPRLRGGDRPGPHPKDPPQAFA